jgi:DNA polymerase-3 subunit beta
MSMNVSLPAEALSKAAALVVRAVSKGSTLPVLAHIALEAHEETLHLTANNLEIGLSVSLPAEVQAAGAICVPGPVFEATCKTLKGADVKLRLDGGTLKIECGAYKGRIAGLPFEDFPPLPQAADEGIRLPDFKRAVAVVAPASSDDETRPTLAAVLFESLPENCLALVAADGFRLTRYVMPEVSAAGVDKLLVPGKSLELAARLVEGEASLHVGQEPGRTLTLRWTAGGMSVTACLALLDGSFPDYTAILPDPAKSQASCTLPGGGLSQAIQRVSIIADQDCPLGHKNGGGTIRLASKDGAMQVEGAVDALGQGCDQVQAATRGEAQVAMASRFVLDALHPWPEQVSLHFYGERAPLLILPEGGGCQTVIMPRAVG